MNVGAVIVAAQDLTQDKMGNEELETFLPMLSYVVYHRVCSVHIVTFAQYNFFVFLFFLYIFNF